MPDGEEATGSSDAQEEPQDNAGALDDGFGDDFDDFEAGAEAEDFGDFDEGFEQPSADPDALPKPEPPPFSKAAFVSNSKYQLNFHQSSSLCVIFSASRAGTGPYADLAPCPSLLCPLRLLILSTASYKLRIDILSISFLAPRL